jgi:hypothetical protein
MQLSRTLLLRFMAAAPLALAIPVRAKPLALRIKGKIRGGDVSLDQEQLAAIGKEQIETRTPWTEGIVRFSGVPFKTLAASLGFEGDEVVLRALNDYSVRTTVATLVQKEALVAFEISGHVIPIRQKGPYWVVFPWSQRDDLDEPSTHSLSVWQLQSVDIR